MTPLIYLDNSAMTRPSDYVVQQMTPFLKRHWRAETAPYVMGKEPFASLRRSVDSIRACVGASNDDVCCFASSAAAALNQFCQHTYLHRMVTSGCNQILTTALEERPLRRVLDGWERGGCALKEMALNEAGQVTVEALEEALSPRTGLVSLAWANSVSGVVHPIGELAALCHQRGVWLHVDVTSLLGKHYFQWRDFPIDALTFDSDRLHGPRGIGALFVRQQCQFQEEPAALFNPAAVVGLGVACSEAEEQLDHVALEVARLRTLFEEGLVAGCGAEVLFAKAERVPHITLISFPGVSAELLAFHLKAEGIEVGVGEVRYLSLRDLLSSMDIPLEKARSALSFGLSYLTTEQEIKQAVGTIVDRVKQCQTLSAAQGVS